MDQYRSSNNRVSESEAHYGTPQEQGEDLASEIRCQMSVATLSGKSYYADIGSVPVPGYKCYETQFVYNMQYC